MLRESPTSLEIFPRAAEHSADGLAHPPVLAGSYSSGPGRRAQLRLSSQLQ